MGEIRHKEELEAFIKRIFDSDWGVRHRLHEIIIYKKPKNVMDPKEFSINKLKTWLLLTKHQLRWDDWVERSDPCGLKQNTHGFCPTQAEFDHFRNFIFEEYNEAKRE